MSHVAVIYKDELESFLGNFKELVMAGHIQPDNKQDMLVFLEFFNKHLYESINPIVIYDLRPVVKSKPFKQ
jgi:hypothetical protein